MKNKVIWEGSFKVFRHQVTSSDAKHRSYGAVRIARLELDPYVGQRVRVVVQELY